MSCLPRQWSASNWLPSSILVYVKRDPYSAFFPSIGKITAIDVRSFDRISCWFEAQRSMREKVSCRVDFLCLYAYGRLATCTPRSDTLPAGQRSSRLAIDRRFPLPFRFVRLGRTSARRSESKMNSRLVEEAIIDRSNFPVIYTTRSASANPFDSYICIEQ